MISKIKQLDEIYNSHQSHITFKMFIGVLRSSDWMYCKPSNQNHEIHKILPMLFHLIGRSLHFNLHRDSLIEVVCDKDDCRYNYY